MNGNSSGRTLIIDLPVNPVSAFDVVIRNVELFDLRLNQAEILFDLAVAVGNAMDLGGNMQAGIGIGANSPDAVLMNPLFVQGGLGIGASTADLDVEEYLSLSGGVGVSGRVDILNLGYAELVPAGIGIGGNISAALTRFRLVSEADVLSRVTMDTMSIAELDRITIE